MRVLLASASERRFSCLLEFIDEKELRVQPLFGDEKSMVMGESVEKQVEKICLSKANNAAIEWSIIEKEKEECPEIIIVSDTIVEDPDDSKVPIGKPKNPLQATNMLIKLSGKKHKVWSSTALLVKKRDGYEPLHGEWKYKIWTNHSVVEFEELGDEKIISLVKSNSWFGKAGGYDLAGGAGQYTKLIRGNELTVLGFSHDAIFELKNNLL